MTYPRAPRTRSLAAAAGALLLATAFAAGCGDDTPTEPSPVTPPTTAPTVTSVTLQAPTAFVDGGQVLVVGETVTLDACATFSDDTERCGVDATWSSSSPTVATVSGSGLVTGVAPGETTISAVYERNTGRATVTVEAAPEPEPSTWNVRGTVTDAETSRGIRRAQIRVLSGPHEDESATTNSAGRYVLRDVAGNMRISVTAEGYREQRTRVNVRMNLTLDFELEPIPAPEDEEPEPPPPTEPAPPPVQRFQNCDAMRSAGWNRGVNRNGGTYRASWNDAERRTYGLNTHSDRDDDGHACE
ncbi:MAG: carboxypeptidase regulatory-like domain-containing protein [Acidobacteria bacterium]|nr:carboxypeptidase regulatory-like domain-containing protein [Acidobacteriota bacterium]